LYHQYSNARVMQARPIPTNMTMNTPPVTINWDVRPTLHNIYRFEWTGKHFLFSTSERCTSGNLKSHEVRVLGEVTPRNVRRLHILHRCNQENQLHGVVSHTINPHSHGRDNIRVYFANSIEICVSAPETKTGSNLWNVVF
jgi:hypothetical protein